MMKAGSQTGSVRGNGCLCWYNTIKCVFCQGEHTDPIVPPYAFTSRGLSVIKAFLISTVQLNLFGFKANAFFSFAFFFFLLLLEYY